MNKIALMCSSVLLAVATSGCQTTGGGPPPRALNADCPYTASTAPANDTCHGGCTIWVEVVDKDGACKIVVGTPEMRVKVKDAWIVWWLPDPWSQNYEFRYEATPFTAPVIFGDPSAAEKQFSRSFVYMDGSKVRIDEQGNNAKDRYLYNIRVYKKGTQTSWQVDPIIANDF